MMQLPVVTNYVYQIVTKEISDVCQSKCHSLLDVNEKQQQQLTEPKMDLRQFFFF